MESVVAEAALLAQFSRGVAGMTSGSRRFSAPRRFCHAACTRVGKRLSLGGIRHSYFVVRHLLTPGLGCGRSQCYADGHPGWLADGFILVLTVCCFLACLPVGGEPPEAQKPGESPNSSAATVKHPWPLWDGQESVAAYAKRAGLEPTQTLDLGNGATMEFVLIPAGRFVMGTPTPEEPPETVIVGQAILGAAGLWRWGWFCL